MVKGILAYCRRAFCAKMRNGCAKASFNPFLSTFLLFFFHWKPARPDALFCSLGLSCAQVSWLFAPAALDRWPEAELLPEARQALDEFREAEWMRREVVLERLLWCLRCREAIYFYINSGIRGPRMPRRRVSWLSTVLLD